MTTIKPTVTDEMIEQAALVLVNSRRRSIGLSPIDRMPWAHTSDLERRHVAAALEAAAAHLYAAALEAMAEHVGPDDGLLMTPAEVKHRLRWQAEQLRRNA